VPFSIDIKNLSKVKFAFPAKSFKNPTPKHLVVGHLSIEVSAGFIFSP
jgi:hypothetical protein